MRPVEQSERIASAIARSVSDDMHADVRHVFPGEMWEMLDDDPDLDLDAWAEAMRGTAQYRMWRATHDLSVKIVEAFPVLHRFFPETMKIRSLLQEGDREG